jgi:2-polyprenyl-6-methoxyphenol hydroxylase-like FAD-dependent oxidoreductase
MSSPRSATETDVLIAGAGPSGLTTAAVLADYGVCPRIIDKRANRSPLSKALVVQARTLELMDLIGLADEFLQHGYPAPGLNVSLGFGSSASIGLQSLDTRFPFLLVLPQERTEEILERRVCSQGVAIERGTELVHLDQHDSNFPTAIVRHLDGREESIRARYVLGCDGAHSTVRDRLGVPFEGTSYDITFFLGDVKINQDFIKSRITNFTSSDGFISILPFLGDYVRVFAVDFTKQHPTPGDELTLEELQDTIDLVVPGKFKIREPRWITRFHSPSRQIPANSVGRVFFAGDAAHSHSPAGGQGMNTGMQDAVNIAWKLAMVLRRVAPEDLLDTVNTERHVVGAYVQHQTDRMLKSFLLRNRVLRALRDFALSNAVKVSRIEHELAGILSGLGVDYSFTERSRRDRARGMKKNSLQAGARVPDVVLWGAQQPVLRLYELLRDRGYVFLVFATAAALGADRHALTRLLQVVAERYGGIISPVVVIDEGVPNIIGLTQPIFIDVRGDFQRKFGAVHGSVILTRPDGFVAFHVRGLNVDPILAALGPWACQCPAAISTGIQPSTRNREQPTQ